MFDEMFPVERDTSLSQSILRPYEPPKVGTWQGFGGTVADAVPYAGVTAAAAWVEMLDAVGKANAYSSMVEANAYASMFGYQTPDFDMKALEAETIGKMGDSQTARDLRDYAKNFAPDPAAVGTAGQIAHGVVSSLVKAGAYSLAGPYAGPVMFGLDIGVNQAKELTDQGVDGGTAAAAGLISGAAGAVGLRVPAAIGATRLQSAVAGAVINPALNVLDVGSTRLLLEHANYDQIAAQYQPFDPVNLTVAAITGGAFGAAFHGSAKGPRLTEDEHAAALTMHEVRVREGDSLTAKGDPATASAASDAQALARQQLDAGEPVSVAQRVAPDPARLDAAYRRVAESDAKEAVDPLRHVRSEDIDGALGAPESWGNLTEATVKAPGWGDVRFVWDHGEGKPSQRITREDIRGFPELFRRFEPIEETAPSGVQSRSWRIARTDADGLPRVVTYSDAPADGQPGRHVVSVRAADDAQGMPVSRERPTLGGDSLAGAEQLGSLKRAADALGNKHPAIKAETPEQFQALEVAMRNPDALIRLDDGTEVPIADLIRHVKDVEQQAKVETAAFDAAVNCALRFPL
ncbi:hypothetical protein [Magnetospirillum aberrantis]|uniref:Uncharacterized protein n=1 Tax=Magnetospirillum aberrantis SpK TaxID=908842 RepID=A0A7C9QW69_9PROT|nr:hypothetical protein [Magnetospirillum aberrantis]NFV82120.1 hypothetical protein [Magnetospirillum aberrantis SpK]